MFQSSGHNAPTATRAKQGTAPAALPDAVCQATNLSVAYGTHIALRNATLTVPRQVVLGIVGPNGAGKSTLIKAMLGLVPTLTGTTEFFGAPLTTSRGRVGYMPQRSNIDWDFPTTVFDAVVMGTYGRLGWFRRPGAQERHAAHKALTQVGLTDVHRRQIGQLSGGQRQRVLLARTLAADPDLLFLDEPFQGVDAVSLTAIVDVLHGLRETGKTVVLVHHDLATVPKYCDHVCLINGEIVANGPVPETFTTENVQATYDISHTHHPFLKDLP